MRTLFKWLFRLGVTLVFLFILLLVLGVLLKDVIAKSLAERNLRDSTGMDAKISKLEIGLGTPTVNLEGLKLYNPPEFGGSTFVDLPELRVEYLPGDMRDGKLRFKTMRLNLAEVHVVKNKQGRTNLDFIEAATRRTSANTKRTNDTPGVEFGGVDTLYLTLRRVRITDQADPLNDVLVDVGIENEVGRNLKDEAAIKQWFETVLLKVAIREAVVGTRSTRERWQKLLRVFGMRV
jgi:uncharacterized protein involved in outer membrane biogenesis